MLAAVLVILVLAVLVSLAATDQVVRFSDISIILLILPTAIVGLVFLALFAGMIYLIGKVLKLLPSYARLAQIYLGRATDFLKSLSDKAAGPVVTVESAWAGVKSIFQRDHRGEETL